MNSQLFADVHKPTPKPIRVHVELRPDGSVSVAIQGLSASKAELLEYFEEHTRIDPKTGLLTIEWEGWPPALRQRIVVCQHKED